MSGQRLMREKLSRFRALASYGYPAFTCHRQLVTMLAAQGHAELQDHFAEPVLDEDKRQIQFVTDLEGTVRKLADLSPEEREEARLLITGIRRGLEDCAQRLRATSGPADGGLRLLELVRCVPAVDDPLDEFMRFVDGYPVVCFWGFEDLDSGGVDPASAEFWGEVDEAEADEALAALRPPPPPPIPTKSVKAAKAPKPRAPPPPPEKLARPQPATAAATTLPSPKPRAPKPVRPAKPVDEAEATTVPQRGASISAPAAAAAPSRWTAWFRRRPRRARAPAPAATPKAAATPKPHWRAPSRAVWLGTALALVLALVPAWWVVKTYTTVFPMAFDADGSPKTRGRLAGAPLEIPLNALDKGDLSFLTGVWQLGPDRLPIYQGSADNVIGNYRLVVQFKDKGEGRVHGVEREYAGKPAPNCDGSATARAVGQKLYFETLVCVEKGGGGRNLLGSRHECTRQADGKTVCRASFIDGEPLTGVPRRLR